MVWIVSGSLPYVLSIDLDTSTTNYWGNMYFFKLKFELPHFSVPLKDALYSSPAKSKKEEIISIIFYLKMCQIFLFRNYASYFTL